MATSLSWRLALTFLPGPQKRLQREHEFLIRIGLREDGDCPGDFHVARAEPARDQDRNAPLLQVAHKRTRILRAKAKIDDREVDRQAVREDGVGFGKGGRNQSLARAGIFQKTLDVESDKELVLDDKGPASRKQASIQLSFLFSGPMLVPRSMHHGTSLRRNK